MISHPKSTLHMQSVITKGNRLIFHVNLSNHNWRCTHYCCGAGGSLARSICAHHSAASKQFPMVDADIFEVIFSLIYTENAMWFATATLTIC